MVREEKEAEVRRGFAACFPDEPCKWSGFRAVLTVTEAAPPPQSQTPVPRIPKDKPRGPTRPPREGLPVVLVATAEGESVELACSQCPYKSTAMSNRQSAVLQHVLSCNRIRPFACANCGRAFPMRRDAQRHKHAFPVCRSAPIHVKDR